MTAMSCRSPYLISFASFPLHSKLFLRRTCKYAKYAEMYNLWHCDVVFPPPNVPGQTPNYPGTPADHWPHVTHAWQKTVGVCWHSANQIPFMSHISGPCQAKGLQRRDEANPSTIPQIHMILPTANVGKMTRFPQENWHRSIQYKTGSVFLLLSPNVKVKLCLRSNRLTSFP